MKLYQQLNEARTQGEWQTFEEGTVGEYSIVASPAPTDGGDLIFEAPINWEASMSRWEANAQYTALAVNNLHHLAEALENIATHSEDKEAVRLAKQALSRIS